MKHAAEVHMEILTWKDKIVMKRQAKHHRENLYTGSGLSAFQGC